MQKQGLLVRLDQCQLVLKSLPNPWCSWIEGETFINTPPAFKSMFRFDENYPLRLADFLSILGDSNRAPFQRALKHIIDFGGNFTLDIDIFDNTKHIQIFGCCQDLLLEDQNKTNSYTKKIIILSMSDISDVFEKIIKTENKLNRLKDESTLLRIIHDIVPVALWYRNAKGRIHACNQVFAGALDTTVHRVIAENRELIDRYGEVSTYELSRMALAKGDKMTIRSHVVVDGQRKYLEISETPVADTSETVGYALDITAIEELETELRVVNQAQREILNYLSSPVALYGADTRLVFFNTSYLTMFQQDERWLLTGPTLSEVIDDMREKRVLPEYSNYVEHKKGRIKLFKTLMEPIHEIMHRPDGVICRLVIAPTPVGGLLYLFDNITDKLLLERRYNTLTAVQKETIDHLYEGIIVFGTDYRLRLSNPAMELLWGVSPENHGEGTHINEILKVIMPQFKSPKASKMWRTTMLDVISRRHPERQRIRLKKEKVLEYSYVPLPDGSHLLSFIDVSDTWRFEKSLQERNRALEHEDRLKSDFISHVSYELQSPLNTISGFSEILMNQYFGALNEKQLDYSKGIAEAADRLMHLMNDMLDLANIAAGKLNLEYQVTRVENLLNSVLGLVQNRANDHGLELILENELNGVEVMVDARRIKHALFNLVANSIKYTPSGGRITIRAVPSFVKGAIDFVVEDTGIGIRENERNHILMLFKQGMAPDQPLMPAEVPAHDEVSSPVTKPKKRAKQTPLKPIDAQGGVEVKAAGAQNESPSMEECEKEEVELDGHDNGIGLGLTLVRKLVELHGGSVYLESEENQGTRVRCTLPLMQPVAA